MASRYGAAHHKLRQIVLAERPWCELALEGCTIEATEVDHIVPVSRGGMHIYENYAAACRRCNAKKQDKQLQPIPYNHEPPLNPPDAEDLLVERTPTPTPETYYVFT